MPHALLFTVHVALAESKVLARFSVFQPPSSLRGVSLSGIRGVLVIVFPPFQMNTDLSATARAFIFLALSTKRHLDLSFCGR